MVKFITLNQKKSILKEDNQILIKLIKKGYTLAKFFEKGYNRRRINRLKNRIKKKVRRKLKSKDAKTKN